AQGQQGGDGVVALAAHGPEVQEAVQHAVVLHVNGVGAVERVEVVTAQHLDAERGAGPDVDPVGVGALGVHGEGVTAPAALRLQVQGAGVGDVATVQVGHEGVVAAAQID